ncbi:MAG: isoprenylcysteine carboxylmethyltransferase family protein [Sphingomonadaceae bacterium]|nr:isoprenylcysteine carboxylmethyltransferase family protein [Sphingomonadaceae bacterium]
MTPPLAALYILWTLWGLSWLAASLWSGRTVARPALRGEFGYRLLTFAGWVLLLGSAWVRRSDGVATPADKLIGVLWRLPTPLEWTMVVLLAAGIAFAWWARITLGRLWSARITRKEDHRVIDSGPYRLVRHPIYTGLLLGAIATAGLRGTVLTTIGLPLFVVGYVMKARIEERLLRDSLGDDYEAYAARVPMLVPFIG